MKLLNKRIFKGSKYTISKFYINGTYFCDVLEDPDRGLNSNQSLKEIQSKKIYGDTAIPTGTYKINMKTVSPKFKDRSWAKPFKGILPRLENVLGYEGVLIHVGKKHEETVGCLSVGENKVKGQVINSTATYNKLMPILLEADSKNELIKLTIE